MEEPINCEVYNSIDDDLGVPVFEVYWEKKSVETRYEKGTYFLVQFEGTEIRATAYQVFDTGSIPGTTDVTVVAVFDDPVNGLVYSNSATLSDTICPCNIHIIINVPIDHFHILHISAICR